MAKQPEEYISRRLGRMEMLLTDLEQLPEGYQATEREVDMAQKLVGGILAIYRPVPVSLEDFEVNYEAAMKVAGPLYDPEVLKVLGLKPDVSREDLHEAVLALAKDVAAAKEEISALVKKGPEKKGK